MVRGSMVVCSLVAAGSVLTPSALAQSPPTPVRITVAAPSLACPAIEGTFVALLAPDRGLLLLSGRAFAGARGETMATRGALTFRLPDGRRWEVEEVRVDAPAQRVYYARYPFRGPATDGCVAFERGRFSSEGDLVSYVYWLVDTVYLQLPAEERRRHPAFAIADRRVTVRVARHGAEPLTLTGSEASALAFRFPGEARAALLVPYVLDASTGRLAIEVARAADLTPPGVPRESLRFVVVARGESVTLDEFAATLTVVAVEPSAP